MNGLLRSRKFYIACFGVLQAVILHYFQVPDDIWQAIAALAATLILGIAVEDAGAKSAVKPANEVKVAIVPPPDKPQ